MYLEHRLCARVRVVGLCPDFREFACVRIFYVFAADVDDGVRMTSEPTEGANEVPRIALVDDDVQMTRLTVGQVRHQLIDAVPLFCLRLKE